MSIFNMLKSHKSSLKLLWEGSIDYVSRTWKYGSSPQSGYLNVIPDEVATYMLAEKTDAGEDVPSDLLFAMENSRFNPSSAGSWTDFSGEMSRDMYCIMGSAYAYNNNALKMWKTQFSILSYIDYYTSQPIYSLGTVGFPYHGDVYGSHSPASSGSIAVKVYKKLD